MDVWQSVPMTFIDPNWTATIGNQSDTVVMFVVEAFDSAGNMAESDGQEFTVAAPVGIPLAWILLLILILVALIALTAYLLWRRRRRRRGTEAVPPSGPPSPPSPPPVTPARKPAKLVAPVKGYGMVSFVVSAHNEEGTISQRIARAYERAVSHAGPSEIIVVDDGSDDSTYEAAWAAVEFNRKKWPNIPAKVVKLSSNLGKEEAVRFGRSKATGEVVETVNGENALTIPSL
jgi:cellulose synthase/poly-beta-1,6-N-acetylglucosamine synthase-like glycosyltransferase